MTNLTWKAVGVVDTVAVINAKDANPAVDGLSVNIGIDARRNVLVLGIHRDANDRLDLSAITVHVFVSIAEASRVVEALQKTIDLLRSPQGVS